MVNPRDDKFHKIELTQEAYYSIHTFLEIHYEIAQNSLTDEYVQ